MHRSDVRSAGGFTLLEVIVALAITGFVLGGLFSLVGSSKQLTWRSQASLTRATQIRAGVMRPEIVIPVESSDAHDDADSQWEAGQLAIGRPLRVIRDPWFGRIGTVSSLPAEPAVLDSGSRTRVLEVDFGNGEKVIVPRANVELIEA